MLLGALHLADHLLSDRSLRAPFGDQLLTDGLGGAGGKRARAPNRCCEIALTPQRWRLITGEPDALVAYRKPDRVAADLGKVRTMLPGGGLQMRGLLGFFLR